MSRRLRQLYHSARRLLLRRGEDESLRLREIRVNHRYYDEDGEPYDGPWRCDNAVATAKYNLLSFIPRSLFEQFRRLANLYFLCMSILMLIGTYTTNFDSPLTPWSTLLPLMVVLAVTMAKEGAEDIKRHRSDALVNSRPCKRLRQDGSGNFENTIWKNIAVGDMIQIMDKEEIPADVVLLTSSEHNGIAFVETSNIDGETNLKIKQCARTNKNGPLWTNPSELDGWKATVQCDLPNAAIHFFHGTVSFDGQEVPVDQTNLLLRGSTLRNTRWALGIVVYTGKETKIVMNAREAPSKLSTVEHTINSLIYLIFVAQLCISAITLTAFLIFKDLNYDLLYYVCYDSSSSDVPMFRDNCSSSDNYSDAAYFLTFFILYNNFIPISLYVTVEMVNYVQAFYIDKDHQMYDEGSDTPALARTSNMNADLGQIAYVFSDKTGTLTQNVMRFKRCSIAGRLYGFPLSSGADSPTAQDASPQEPAAALEQLAFEAARDFESLSPQALFMLINSVCHTVQLDTETGELQAESPDEEALVRAAAEFGFKFTSRAPGQVTICVNNKLESFEILAMIPFDSERKRMTTVVRRLDQKGNAVGDVLVLVKGADNIILERSTSYIQDHTNEQLIGHLDLFAGDGLRTLVLAVRHLPLHEYEVWAKSWRQAELAMVDRDAEMARVAVEIERELCVVGATAIEDRLQDDVPATIADMHRASIKLWVLTGDKMETAINIGYSCRLLRKDMVVMKLKHAAGGNSSSVKIQLRRLYDHFSRVTADPHLVERLWSNLKTAVAQAAEKLHLAREPTSASQNSPDIIIGDPNNMSESLLEEHEHVPLIDKPPHLPELSQLSSKHLALIVDGPTLNDILGDNENEQLFLTIAKLCNAVIACRVSPSQKRMLVRLVKRGVSPKPITLAIGDGANDVGMIQEAQIGVGISGKEGRQAVNNSDFAIAQFRFLKNLLLVHGRWDYRRICKVVLYSFYKNIVLTFILFGFTFQSAFSGQSLFEDYVYAGYNFFLFLPVFAFGIFDQDVSAQFVMKNPVIYVSGLEYMDMNLRLMGQYLAQAVVDSILIFAIPYAAYFGVGGAWSDNGDAHGLYVFGTTVYTVLFISMLLKAGNLTYNWNKWTIACWVFSILLYFVFLLAYEQMLGAAYNFYGVTTAMFNTPVFWLLILLVPTMTWMLDLLVMTIKSQRFPTIVDIGVEKDRGFGPSTDLLHPEEVVVAEPGNRSRSFSHAPGRPKFDLDWKSLKVLNETTTDSERQEMGMKDTSTERLDSSFSYDHVSSAYGPGAGSRFRRAARRVNPTPTSASPSSHASETKHNA